MNIKITKEEADFILKNHKLSQHLMGSRLYGTHKEDSDTDYLIMYDSFHKSSDLYYPNYHQFQYDDVENNTQYVFTSDSQFYKNLFSGDSTINADIIMFSTLYGSESDRLNILRTYNIIKAYIGFAKRDLKSFKQNKGKNKLFHAARGLYCAEELILNRLPKKEYLSILNVFNFDELGMQEVRLRYQCNELFEQNDLTMYPKLPLVEPVNNLEKLITEANNIREFKY